MSRRSRIEGLGAAVTLLAALAFLASFAIGLRGVRDPGTASTPPVVADPAPRTGRIEVLNASGQSGVARAVTQRLRVAGFDVVYFGNASSAHGDSTVVLDRTGRADIARAVARELGIDHVVTQRDSTLFLDATVVLGRDWERSGDDQSSVDPTEDTRVAQGIHPGS